jgi:hypothetical protein
MEDFENIWKKSLREHDDDNPDGWWLKNVLNLLRKAEKTLEDRGGDDYVDEYLALREVIDTLSSR